MSVSRPPRVREIVADLAARGMHHFATGELRSALGVSAVAARQALSRLAAKGEVASPARGFYVIVPPEYRRLGCLPADQFVPALMSHWKRPYYVGLLSAAQYHGAAHHRPQAFQVVLGENRPPISCGSVRVSFIARRNIAEAPVRSLNTARGEVVVSTVETTAIDLVGYSRHAGGLDQVASLLSEFADEIDPQLLVIAARTAPIAWGQRLGFLLEHVGAGAKAAQLQEYVKRNARHSTVLLTGAAEADASRDDGWRLRVNTDVDAEA